MHKKISLKTGINSKDLFGVTQEELSMLFKITRSQSATCKSTRTQKGKLGGKINTCQPLQTITEIDKKGLPILFEFRIKKEMFCKLKF